MDSPIIQVKDINAHYGDVHVLKDISFSVERGEIFAVIGGSGCGKTTLFKHMIGLLRPTSGSILHEGEDITCMDEDELAAVQQRMGVAFQSSGLFNSLSVRDNVALPLEEYSGFDPQLIEAVVRLKLSLVGLQDAAEAMPSQLSGGMKKRAGLARAIALDPPVLYLDEPSAGLDPIMAAGLDDLILNLKRLLGITVLIITHELDSIRKVADRILMLDESKVLFCGTVEEAEYSDIARIRQFFERRADASIERVQ